MRRVVTRLADRMLAVFAPRAEVSAACQYCGVGEYKNCVRVRDCSTGVCKWVTYCDLCGTC
ncbi:hypothetical protein [Bailinhaonella thermotolerans]|uniref:Uncharacterized protein n=1 Tax=Bailinhaonella thermotolerans TaxID=1070861 RepID=A0A3A4B0L5_9ACTN|nr:hypothetical protein [Bailinhaonella thermotolerans]RJL34379.1 hypothetical protein D5H75_08040 [Bailinhaonella thermotolerans]